MKKYFTIRICAFVSLIVGLVTIICANEVKKQNALYDLDNPVVGVLEDLSLFSTEKDGILFELKVAGTSVPVVNMFDYAFQDTEKSLSLGEQVWAYKKLASQDYVVGSSDIATLLRNQQNSQLPGMLILGIGFFFLLYAAFAFFGVIIPQWVDADMYEKTMAS